MKAPRRYRRVALALCASAALHLLGLWLLHAGLSPAASRPVFRLRAPRPPLPAERFALRPPPHRPRQPVMERRRAEAVPRPVEVEPAAAAAVDTAAPPEAIPELGEPLATAEKGAWRADGEALPKAVAPTVEWAPDPLRLDAERRRRSVILIDPEDPGNLKAYLHLPASVGRGRRALDFALYLRRAHMLGDPSEYAVDLHITLHTYRRHYRLRLEDMRPFPLIWTQLLAVPPQQDELALYLEEGGFLLAGPPLFERVEALLRARAKGRLERLYLSREHPLFRCFYAIADYHFVSIFAKGPCLRSVMPVDALRLDGRVVALSTYMSFDPGQAVKEVSRHIGYVSSAPCLANRFAVNVFLYGLLQPGRIGQRYIARRPAASASLQEAK